MDRNTNRRNAMSKHTQGPWKADGYSIRQASAGTRHVAEIAYTGPHHTPPEEYPKSCRLQDEANARLIAAAPRLLSALIEMRDWYADNVGLPACKANAAIADAIGDDDEQPDPLANHPRLF